MSPAGRRLFVLRHAKSRWDEGVSDHERGLSPRGLRAVATIQEHLEREAITPELVLCSPARRARATLEPLVGTLGDPVVQFEPRLYGAAEHDLMVVLRLLADQCGSVMVVGHNPGVQDLVLALASDGDTRRSVREKFPTAALATLALGSTWRALQPGQAALTVFVTPRVLRGV